MSRLIKTVFLLCLVGFVSILPYEAAKQVQYLDKTAQLEPIQDTQELNLVYDQPPIPPVTVVAGPEAAKAIAPVSRSVPKSSKKTATRRTTGSSSKTASQGTKTPVIGTSPVIGRYTQTDLYWLAKMVYAESAAEPYNGQVAVAAVILHRVASPEYPNTVKGVLYQVVDGHYQFSPVLNGYINKVEPNRTAYRAAREALAGKDPSKGAILYYNPRTSTNKWILSRPITVVIGNHTFAK